MKKTLLLALVAAITLAATSCSKERRCQCTNVNNEKETTYVLAKRGLGCGKIKKIGIERMLEGKLVREMTDVNCTEAKD